MLDAIKIEEAKSSSPAHVSFRKNGRFFSF